MSYIFNIGLSRAGTVSLTEALRILGYRALHHTHDNERIPRIIQRNQRVGKRLFYGLEDYDAFTDFKGWEHFKTLDTQYPGSLFIFTYRDIFSWLQSQYRHNKQQNRDVNLDKLENLYKKAFTDVTRYFRKRDDILFINIPAGEGWEKLCPFLGVQIPTEPFPNKNKSTNEKGNIHSNNRAIR